VGAGGDCEGLGGGSAGVVNVGDALEEADLAVGDGQAEVAVGDGDVASVHAVSLSWNTEGVKPVVHRLVTV